MTGTCKHIFRFRPFRICNNDAGLRVNTDSVLLGAWTPAANPARILDAGTGNGLLALMVAYKYPGATVDAVDISSRALALARLNMDMNPSLARRIRLFRKDLKMFQPDDTYDMIISNPPYFDGTPPPDGLRQTARQEGAAFIHALFHLAGRHLYRDGKLYLLWPTGRRHELLDTGYRNRLFPAAEVVLRDHPQAKTKRSLWEWTPRYTRHFRREEFILFRPDGQRTGAFDRLVKNWYLT